MANRPRAEVTGFPVLSGRRPPRLWLRARDEAIIGSARLFSGACGVAVSGAENLPARGPYIIAANHASHLDSLLVAANLPGTIWRQLVCLAAKEWFHTPVLGWLARAGAAIPIDRQGACNLSSLHEAMDRLRSGLNLLVFPAGRRSRTGEVEPFKPGVGFLSFETGAPVVPLYLGGTFEILPRWRRIPSLHPISIRIGAPLRAESYRSYAASSPFRYKVYKRIAGDAHSAVCALAGETLSAPSPLLGRWQVRQKEATC